MMRSLAFKLTLAFLLVGLIGSVLVAVLVSYRTRQEFDRFVSNRDTTILVDFLEGYYADNEGWQGVERLGRRFTNFRGPVFVTDVNGRIVLSNNQSQLNQIIEVGSFDDKISLQADNEQVGWLIWFPHTNNLAANNAPEIFRNPNRPPFLTPDVIGAEFLNNVTWASAISTGIAIITALIMGLLLARSLTKPIRELTAATKKMAAGELGYQVPVQSKDEIGGLAKSFNQMSHDLAQNQKVRRQMTADIAHDLRTPLTVLRGYMEGLKDGRLDGNHKLYKIMFGEVSHLQHLVEELRTLSLADAGELSLNIRQIDPKALLERCGLAHIMQAEEKGLTLRVEADDHLPSVAVDSDRMAQVLSNLVSNAITHTKEGEIVLSATQTNEMVQLHVKDSGLGIEQQDLPHIFNRFYRADQSRNNNNSSSGLGLAIAKAIVEAHGGEITAVSVPNNGTTMTIGLSIKN